MATRSRRKPKSDAVVHETPPIPGTEPVVSVPETLDAAHQEAVSLLRGRCLEMAFTVHGLPKSRRITGKMADSIAVSAGGKRAGIKASWSMFASAHPAVKNLSVAMRELDKLRDEWTIVRSAVVQRGEDDKVAIEGGKRLIWDKDVEPFFQLFVRAAHRIDLEVIALQHAMDHTVTIDGKIYRSVKELDRDNSGDAWDEAAYPKDLRLECGVARERHPDGTAVVGEDGLPKYAILFEEYHVSEKLPELLQKRAIERLEQGLSGTLETAVKYSVNELTSSMLTFMGELANRTMVYPHGEFAYLTAHGEAEIVKLSKHEDTPTLPVGHVKALIRYPVKEGEVDSKVTRWFGPYREVEFFDLFRPQATGQVKKIYPSVVEGIISSLQAFRDRKSKMLGVYGTNLVSAFDPLLTALTAAKVLSPLIDNATAASRLVDGLRNSDSQKALIKQAIANTVEALEEQVEVVKVVARRRSVRASLVGQFN